MAAAVADVASSVLQTVDAVLHHHAAAVASANEDPAAAGRDCTDDEDPGQGEGGADLVMNLARAAPLALSGGGNGSVSPALEAFLDREASMRQHGRVNWSNLEACFKWRLIQTYLRGRGVQDVDPVVGELRGLLSSKRLRNVEYDSSERRVLRLNHGDL